VCHLGQTVDNDKDGGEALGIWKLGDEIHRDRGPRCLWDGQWLQEAIGLVARGLVALTGVTTRNEPLDELSKTCPVVRATDELAGFVDTEMARGHVIVAGGQDVSLDTVVSWDHDTSLVKEKAVIEGVVWVRVIITDEIVEQLVRGLVVLVCGLNTLEELLRTGGLKTSDDRGERQSWGNRRFWQKCVVNSGFPLLRRVYTGESVGGTVQHARTVDDGGLELGQSFSITDLAFAERAFF
jgi:hypothetical protein